MSKNEGSKLQFEHLRDLSLSDFVGDVESIDVQILIGLDYYFSSVTGRCKKGEAVSPIDIFHIKHEVACCNAVWYVLGNFRVN